MKRGLPFLLLAFFVGADTLAAPTYLRTICQDPRDKLRSRPLCTRSTLNCPAGKTLTGVRAACESDQIKDINWSSVGQIPWNQLFVSRTDSSASWSCSVGNLRVREQGVHDLTSAVGTGKTRLSFACLGGRHRRPSNKKRLDPSCQILVEYRCE